MTSTLFGNKIYFLVKKLKTALKVNLKRWVPWHLRTTPGYAAARTTGLNLELKNTY